MKNSRLLFLVVSMLAVFSMLLTACGGDATPTTVPVAPTTAAQATTAPTTAATAIATGATDTPAAAAASPTTAATTAAGGDMTPTGAPAPPTSTPRPGEKVLRMNLGSEPSTVDPQKMSFVGEIGFGAMNFEALLELNEKLQPVPAAAEKMDVSADGLKYTLTLRDGLKYSDGTPLTAHNFEYAFRRLFDPNLQGRDYASVAYDIAGSQALSEMATPTDTVKLKQLQDALGVKALDDKHIQFTLGSPVAYFPYILAIWVGWPTREDMVKAGGDSWTEPKTYIGNGPYVLTEWNHGNGVVWEANANYRKGKPKIDRIEMREITESAVSFQAYKNGELDFSGVAAEDLKTVKSDPTLSREFSQIAGSCNFYLGFNTQKAPFNNVKVRQAFAQAFDRQDYVDVVLKGLGQPALSFIPPGRPGYEPDVKQADFNADGAKKSLADAGFPNGQNLPPIKLTYSSTARNKVRMEWIQAQMKTNMGIDAQLDPVEPKSYTELTKKAETLPQLFFLGWCQDYPDPQDWLSLVFRSDSTVTHIGWKNAQFDQLTKQADIEKDATKRLALYKQAQQILADDAPVVFLYWDVTPTLIKPYITGMREHQTPDDAIIPGFKNIVNIDIQK